MTKKEVPELTVGDILTSQLSVTAELAGCLESHEHLLHHQIVMIPTLFIGSEVTHEQ